VLHLLYAAYCCHYRQSESVLNAASTTTSIHGVAVTEANVLQQTEQAVLSNAKAAIPQVPLSAPPLHLADGATIVSERVVTSCDSSSDSCSSSGSVSKDHTGKKHVLHRSLLHQYGSQPFAITTMSRT
jgi:hypothetical protein